MFKTCRKNDKACTHSGVAHKIARRAAMLLCAGLLCAYFCIAAFAQTTAAQKPALQKRILYISSYSFSWGSVPFQMQGLGEGLGNGYVVNYEFMDTKNTVYSDGYREFYDLLKYKLSTRHPYDAVVVCDDAALNFVQQYKAELFPGLPIVFSGIDNVQNGIDAAKSAENETGIVEIVDYGPNTELAHELLPKAHRLVLILDNMENGVGIAAQLKASNHIFNDYDVEYLNSSDYTREELEQKLSELDDTSIVFCISMGQSKDGTVYSEEERYAMIRDYVKVPLFRFTQSGIGNGLLGGYIVDHEASCKIAGEMLRQILETGVTPPIDLDTPQKYYFDYNVMQRYNISMRNLPAGVRGNCDIKNQPEGFLKAHAFAIVSLLCVLITLLLIITLVNHTRHIEKLGKAVREAEQANKAKSQFLARMSHDMRTPMNTIINLSRMVEGELSNPQAAKADLHSIHTENQFLLTLINDVLDASRIEAGKMQLHPDMYRWEDFLNYMHSTFDEEAKEKEIALDILFDKPAEAILVDKERFNQICFNLVSNALRFNKPGGFVRFKMQFAPEQNGVLPCDIIVEDNGIGISDEFKEHLFVAFEQEGRAYETLQGAGLGLAIVKNIVDAMGGTIAVDSHVNVGTTFTVHLPLKAAPAAPKTVQQSEADVASVLKGKRILLVEDHPMNQKIAARLLTGVGASVDIADNGQKALDMVGTDPTLEQFDAILMDLRMPVMDGLTATQEIRKLPCPRAKTIPIIAVTANTSGEDIAKCAEVGMNAYVAKPIDPKILFGTIHKHLCCGA